MNRIYFLLKLNRYIHNPRIKSLGVFVLHLLNKRYLGIFLDPVLACNLRCRMCYFSDPEKRKSMKGMFSMNDLHLLSKALFERALKLQIGCGAEPSLFQYNKELILLAKSQNVPYVSMTTNANLLIKEDWMNFVGAGLDEATLSLHGILKETYEYMMPGASYENLIRTLENLTEIKKLFPQFKVRLNYTVNKDNLEELRDLYTFFAPYRFDILQIRPINKLGETDYRQFSWEEIYDRYDEIIGKLKEESRLKGVMCIVPDKVDFSEEKANDNKLMEESTYCYVSPKFVWRNDFDLYSDTYASYSRRTKLGRKLLNNVFLKKQAYRMEKSKLNYEIN